MEWRIYCQKGQINFSHGNTNSCGVLTGFYGNINVVIRKQSNNENGRILILEVTSDDTEYLLNNIYHANAEQHQLEFLSILLKNVILAGDFNLFFN